MTTLLHVNAMLKAEFNKIATLDLTKAYDNGNPDLLWKDGKIIMCTRILRMTPVCF